MAEERIDIEVTDKVDANVAKKFEQIAAAADRGASYVDKLKSALAAVNTSSVDKLVSAMARADSAQAKLVNAQVRLSQAQNTGSMAAAKLATQQQKLATEAARTEAATARAAAASASAESAAIRLASAQQRVTATAGAAGSAEEQLAADLALAKSRFDAGELSIRGYVLALNQARTVASGAAQPIVDNANKVEQSAKQLEKAASRTRSSNANVIAQLQDIGVSLAGGQNPLLVLIQQGAQLDYIARTTANGWSGLTMQILKMLAPFTLLVAAIGAAYLGFKNFSSEIATRNKPELEAYANTLGLTSKEMAKLSNETVGAGGKLKEFNVITITSADSWKGFVATVKQGWAGLVASWGPANKYFEAAWSLTTKVMYLAFLGFYGSVHGLIQLLWKTGVNVFKILANAVIGVANTVVMTVETLVNGAISGINALGAGANWVLKNLGFDTVIPEIDKVNMGVEGLTQNMFKLESMNIGEVVSGKVREGARTIEGFSKAWEDAATAAAKARIAALAAAIVQNRTGGASGPSAEQKAAERRALAIGMVNLKLDDELARMKLLKDERAIQQRMDQIEESLAQKKIQLNDAERLSIEGKVRAIEAYKYVQSEVDRISEEAIAPQRLMNATVEAATRLYDDGTISAEKYAEQLRVATRTYDEATNPLFNYNEAIDSALKTTGLYGVELEKANYLEQLRLDLARQGKTIYDESTGSLTKEVQALVAKNDQLRQQQLIQSQLGGVLNPILAQADEVTSKAAVYAELERLRQLDKINEETYQQALHGLYVKYNEMRLNSASSFFGALAEVTRNGTGAVGAIGKAAAIAQATIDGYVAVQKALASAPPPWNYIAAAGVAIKTGTQVAGIRSTNVGSFATGGQFMVDGKSGVDANNINMNVTKGERVTIETPAQQRANDASAAPVVNANTKVVNLFDEASFVGAMDSDEGERVVMNIIRRNPNAIQAVISRG